jgi:hypothetical protein
MPVPVDRPRPGVHTRNDEREWWGCKCLYMKMYCVSPSLGRMKSMITYKKKKREKIKYMTTMLIILVVSTS